MVNRPLNAPCWVVFTYVGGQDGHKGSRYYMGSPDAAHAVRVGGLKFSNYDGHFTAQHVEPFLNELDAIAAALLVDGFVDKYEPGSQWPVGMKDYRRRRSEAMDIGSNGGTPYNDE